MLIIWTTGFLFSVTSLDACVIGMVGESAVLPCVYNGTFGLDSGDVSVEWRTGSELVHTSALGKDGEVARSVSLRNGTRLVTDVIRNGNVSLLVSDVTVRDSRSYDCYLTRPGVKSSAHLCTVCLSAAAHFTHPVVLRQGGGGGGGSVYLSLQGGFPKPRVHWFIDDTEHPLVDTVRTYSTLLPDSELYNITSILSVNVTHDMTVSCLVENRLLSENLTSFTFGVEASPTVGRASEAMWMFTTALCVLVVALVVSVVGYQIKQDYDRRHNPQKPQESEDSSIADQKERVILEHLNSLTETTV